MCWTKVTIGNNEQGVFVIFYRHDARSILFHNGGISATSLNIPRGVAYDSEYTLYGIDSVKVQSTRLWRLWAEWIVYNQCTVCRS